MYTKYLLLVLTLGMWGAVQAQSQSNDTITGCNPIEKQRPYINVSIGAGMVNTNFGRLADLFPNGGNSPDVHDFGRSFAFSVNGFNPSKRFAWGTDIMGVNSRPVSNQVYRVENSSAMITLNFGVNWLPKCKRFQAITMVGVGGFFGNMITSAEPAVTTRGRQNISYDSFLADPVQSTNITYSRWLGNASILLQYAVRKRWIIGAKATMFNTIAGRSFYVNDTQIKGAPKYSPQGSSLTFSVGYRF
jgi:hypothetical protein